jgi:glycosyltransferase involved in cell wall biosynthesis
MRHFIVFGEDWGAHPSSTQHLIKRLATQEKVTWINSVGMRKPSFRFSDIQRLLNKSLLTLSSVWRRCSQETEEFSPNIRNLAVLPWHDNVSVNRFNKLVLKNKIGAPQQREQRIYWVSVPSAISMIDKQPGDIIIYYCGDDFLALDGVDHTMIAPLEQTLIEQADIIFVASEYLIHKMPSDKTFVLSHGVDFELFSRAIAPAEALASDAKTIGFYGSISNWLDLEVLETLVSQRPGYQLMLVGECKISIDSLLAYPNVTHIDKVQHNELPKYSQNWDVSILPFINNRQIQSCDPLKLKEYLAAGTPVVSTRFNAVEKYQDIVQIADDPAEFICKIDQVLKFSQQQKMTLAQRSRKSVVEHSWGQKAQDALTHLSKHSAVMA